MRTRLNVKVEMKEGMFYRGILGGFESGFLRLLNPEMTANAEVSRPAGNKKSAFVMLPAGDIKRVVSQ